MKLDLLKLRRLQAKMFRLLNKTIPQYSFKLTGGTMSEMNATLKVLVTPRRPKIKKTKSKRP